MGASFGWWERTQILGRPYTGDKRRAALIPVAATLGRGYHRWRTMGRTLRAGAEEP